MRTGRSVAIAGNDLSRLINTLEAHHAEERAATDAAVAAFAGKLGTPLHEPPEHELLRARAAEIEAAALGMRSQRGVLLEHLLGLRAPLVDVILEVHGGEAPDTTLAAHVEPHTTLPAPTPIPGLDLDADGRLRILDKTLKWSRQITYGQAVMALGPCHVLAYAIEHPTPEATALGAQLFEAGERLRGFLFRTFQY